MLLVNTREFVHLLIVGCFVPDIGALLELSRGGILVIAMPTACRGRSVVF